MMTKFLISWFISPIYKIVKWCAFFLAFLFVAGYIFQSIFELNNLRGFLSRHIQKEFNQYVQLAGDVSMDFDLLRPSLTFSDVTWEQGKGKKWHADSVSILIPVMTWKKPEIPEVELLFNGLEYNNQVIGDLVFPTKFTDQNNFRLLIQSDIWGGRAMGVIANVEGVTKINLALRSINYGEVFKGYDGTVDANIRMKSELLDFDFNKFEEKLNGDIAISGGKATWPAMGVEFWTSSLLTSLIPGRKAPKETKIACFAGDIYIKDSWASSENIVLDSKDLVILASGRVNYAKEYLDLKVKPEPKDPSILNLATNVRVKGPWASPKVKPSKLGVATKVGGVLLSAVNPAALVLPLTDFGHFSDTACTKRKEKIARGKAELND